MKNTKEYKNLLIVESPAKAKTINRYLGDDFKVMATVGHVIDLPKSELGVDVEKGYEPLYQVKKSTSGARQCISCNGS